LASSIMGALEMDGWAKAAAMDHNALCETTKSF
jgi:hypothetical protein